MRIRHYLQFIASLTLFIYAFIWIGKAEERLNQNQIISQAVEQAIPKQDNNIMKVKYSPREQNVLDILEGRLTDKEEEVLAILENKTPFQNKPVQIAKVKPKSTKPKKKPKPKPEQFAKAIPKPTPFQPVKFSAEVMCLAEAMFYEAQGEKVIGKIGVADTIINRSNNSCFPDTICKVISQPKQFQWKANRGLRKGRIFNPNKHTLEMMLAEKLYNDETRGIRRDTTGGALYFAAHGYNPSRNARFIKTEGGHKFYSHNNKRVNCSQA